MQRAERAAACPFDHDSGAEALHPQQVGICLTTLARLTALPLPGEPLGTTAMLLARGLCFAKSKIIPPGQHHSMQDQQREPPRTPVMS